MKNKDIRYFAIMAIVVLNTSCCVAGYCQMDNLQSKNENQIKEYNTNQE